MSMSFQHTLSYRAEYPPDAIFQQVAKNPKIRKGGDTFLRPLEFRWNECPTNVRSFWCAGNMAGRWHVSWTWKVPLFFANDFNGCDVPIGLNHLFWDPVYSQSPTESRFGCLFIWLPNLQFWLHASTTTHTCSKHRINFGSNIFSGQICGKLEVHQPLTQVRPLVPFLSLYGKKWSTT